MEKEPEEKQDSGSKEAGSKTTEDEESKKEESDEGFGEAFRGKVQGFFFDPQMDPKPENWIGLVALFGLVYYLINHREPRREIVYKDFLSKYLMAK